MRRSRHRAARSSIRALTGTTRVLEDPLEPPRISRAIVQYRRQDEHDQIGDPASPGEQAGRNLLAAAARTLESEAGVQAITDSVVAAAGSCFARIWQLEPDARWLVLVGSSGLSRRIAGSSRARIDLQSYPYMVGWVARTQQRMMKSGIQHDPRFDPTWGAHERLVAAAVIPLEYERKLVGVMAAFFRQPIGRETERRVDVFAAMAAVAIAIGAPARRPLGALPDAAQSTS